jgi:hypothetical protein
LLTEAGPFGTPIGNALYKIEKVTPMPFDARPFGAPISNTLYKIEKITIFEPGKGHYCLVIDKVMLESNTKYSKNVSLKDSL